MHVATIETPLCYRSVLGEHSWALYSGLAGSITLVRYRVLVGGGGGGGGGGDSGGMSPKDSLLTHSLILHYFNAVP